MAFHSMGRWMRTLATSQHHHHHHRNVQRNVQRLCVTKNVQLHQQLKQQQCRGALVRAAAAEAVAGSDRCGEEKPAPMTPGAVGAEEKGAPLTIPGYGADGLLFDEVILTAIGGRGGNGEAQPRDKGRTVKNFKYSGGRNLKKKMFLPAGNPTSGGDGGDVVLVCDPGLRDLGHIAREDALQAKMRGMKGKSAEHIYEYRAGKGKSADLSLSLVATRQEHKMQNGKACEIRVPPGTVVMKKRGGRVIGECLTKGDRVVVARGGSGGLGVREPSASERKSGRRGGWDGFGTDVQDDSWKTESRGLEGEQATVRLVLRMMIDIGLVGFPNAGKSSLLRALTRAAPKVAPYPFTTLAPSLGVLVTSTSTSGDARGTGSDGVDNDELEELRFRDASDTDAESVDVDELIRRASSSARSEAQPVIGDLPGLIEGAHVGRGLGRIFLKHLRRARIICYVIDVSTDDGGNGQSPASDFECLFEELRMYNPEYVRRPAVVVLNKVDMLRDPAEDGSDGEGECRDNSDEGDDVVARAMKQIAASAREKVHTVDGAFGGKGRASLPIVTTSALMGTNIDRLATLVSDIMREL